MYQTKQVSRWREVIKVRTLMKAYKVKSDSESYSWTITALVAMGRMHDATRILAEMGDMGLAPSYDFVDRWSEMAAAAERRGVARGRDGSNRAGGGGGDAGGQGEPSTSAAGI